MAFSVIICIWCKNIRIFIETKKKISFEKANLNKIFHKSIYGDILDSKKLSQKINSIKPTVIFHLAAQPLVVDSYKNPKKPLIQIYLGQLIY